MYSPATIVRQLGTVATRQQLLAAGLSGYDLTRAVRRGEIIRCRQARYILPTTEPDVAAAVRVGGLLAGPSAARTYGLWAGFDRRLHISVGANGSRLRTNYPPSFVPASGFITPDTVERHLVIHWLANGAVPELGPESWRVTLAVCLRQMVAWADRENAIACLDTALKQLRPGELARIFATEPASARLVAAACCAGSDSGQESLVRQRLRSVGLEVTQQVRMPGVGPVDMQVVGTRVLIETDGYAYHGDRAAFERDRWRDAELVARGFIVVRLSYARVTTDWPWCLRVIRAAIERA